MKVEAIQNMFIVVARLITAHLGFPINTYCLTLNIDVCSNFSMLFPYFLMVPFSVLVLSLKLF